MIRSFVALGIAFGMLLVAGGCCIYTGYEAFRSPSVGSVVKFLDSYATARLRLDEVEVWIQVQNYPDNDMQRVLRKGVWSPKVWPEPASSVRLFLEVSPRDGEIELDPERIRIRLDDGSEVSPRGLWRPGVGRPDNGIGPGPIWFSCGRPTDLAQPVLERGLRARWALEYGECFNCPGVPAPMMSESWEPLRTETPSCLVLLFETSNSPETGMTVVIDHLRSADRMLDVPEIRFEKGWLYAKPCV